MAKHTCRSVLDCNTFKPLTSFVSKPMGAIKMSARNKAGVLGIDALKKGTETVSGNGTVGARPCGRPNN